MFKTPHTGLTYYDGKEKLSTYKLHYRDPVLFKNGLKLVFRNNEKTKGCGTMDLCPDQYCKPGEVYIHFNANKIKKKTENIF